VSLVFVQSKDGNTGTTNPADLGGGPTDHHLIYEGLSRAAAGAVLAGATTASGAERFFSVWHPELVALRAQLGLARHPVQIVVSRDGHLNVAGTLLFNVPDVTVVVLAGAACRRDRARDFAERPWIDVLPFDDRDWKRALAALRGKYRIHRISAVGGRTTAASLLDAGVVTDICLTTTSREAGEKHTPYYNGSKPPRTSLILRKTGGGLDDPITVEQLAVT
jgi:riboflavin biosynthesis pyrimidine reductase